jgi:hypothetical protein
MQLSQSNSSQHLGEARGSKSLASIGHQNSIYNSETEIEAPMTIDEEFPEPICGGCKILIDETSADAGVIHFA